MAISRPPQRFRSFRWEETKNIGRPAEPEPAPGRMRALRLASLGVWAALGGLFYLVFRPGIFITDTYGQFQEALMFGFSNWHPPVMAFWWHLLLPVAGAGAMLLFHGLLYWGGFALIADWAIRVTHRFPVALVIVALLPTSFLYAPYVWKDVGLAASILVLAGAYLHLRSFRSARWLWALAIPVACYAVNLRHFALLALFPLLGLLAGLLIRRTRTSLLGWMGAVGLGLIAGAGLNLAGRAFDRYVLRSAPNTASHVQYFDLVGTLSRARAMDEFPREFLTAQGTPEKLAAAYASDPFNADIFSAWGRAAVWIQTNVGGRIDGPWLRAIMAHPRGYLSHRLAFAGKLLTQTDWYEYPWAHQYAESQQLIDFIRDNHYAVRYADRNDADRAARETYRATVFQSNAVSRFMPRYIYGCKWLYLPLLMLSVAALVTAGCLWKRRYGLPPALALSVIAYVAFLCVAAPMTFELRYLHPCCLATGVNLWLLGMSRRYRLDELKSEQ